MLIGSPRRYILYRCNVGLSPSPDANPKPHKATPTVQPLSLLDSVMCTYIYIYTYTCARCSNNNKVWWVRIPKTNNCRINWTTGEGSFDFKTTPTDRVKQIYRGRDPFSYIYIGMYTRLYYFDENSSTWIVRFGVGIKQGSSTCNSCLAVYYLRTHFKHIIMYIFKNIFNHLIANTYQFLLQILPARC